MPVADAGAHVRERVPAALAGERVDRVVALMTGLPRALVATLVARGAVAIGNVAVTKPGRRVAEGDVVDVALPADEGPDRPEADAAVHVRVVHADEAVVVVDKPAGVVVHPGAGNPTGTLVNALLVQFPEIADVDSGNRDRPGIVHRLDAGTSGLLVVARTTAAYASLVEQLSRRTVERVYRVLVLGHLTPPTGIIDAPIGRARADPTRMAVAAGGRDARTSYEVRERFIHPLSCCELTCRLETGRTHQIRVHLAAVGHPVAGDRRYGGARPALRLSRPYLHAERLAFDHPTTGERATFDAPLPDDLAIVRAELR